MSESDAISMEGDKRPGGMPREFSRRKHAIRRDAVGRLPEASRVVQHCGRIGIVHFLVPMPPPGCRLQGVRGITTGCGYRIRAFSIFEKDQESLFEQRVTA